VAHTTKRQFLKIFIPFLLAVLAALSVYVLLSYQQAREIIQTNEFTQIELARKSIYRDIESILPDINVLLNSGLLQNFLDKADATTLNDLTQGFASFAEHKRIYDSIRYLDEQGMEVIRVNYSNGLARITPVTNLQDKSGRYYFRDSINLDAGDVYISPIDLNVEYGEVQIPYKPTIRFGAPVFDQQGRSRGVLVLNYLAENMLAHFDDMLAGSAGHVALLNPEGYWIRSHKKEREWGFMLNHQATFQKGHPDAWSFILNNSDGQIISGDGIFTHTTIFLNSIASKAAGEDYFWKIVSDVHPEAVYKNIIQHLTGVVGLSLMMILFIGTISSWEIARHRAERQKLREQAYLHAQVYKATTDGIIITNTSGRIVDVNQSFSDITGYTREEALGQNPSMLSSGEQDRTFYKNMWSEISRTGRWQGEIHNRKKDGGLFIEWLRISAVKDSEGKTIQYVGVISDITAKKQTEQELHRNAHHDALTGLPNRLSLDQLLQQEINHSDRDGTELALLYIDLDRFKPINDSYGHLTGDVVLKTVAQRLGSVIRKADNIARYGGDEFIALLSGITNRHIIEEIISRMQSELRKPIEVNGRQHVIGASIGIAIYPTDTEDATQLIIKADEAMYQAKHSEDRHHVYFESLNHPRNP
jgi:diguanylate cyclase (GGDEF)-like protein/PAS domain S-box-containing protein